MKKLVLLILLGTMSTGMMAQIGLSIAYKNLTASAWEDNISRINSTIGEQQVPLDNGWALGVDYWFRLKNTRIEFLPELNYSTFSQDWSTSEATTGSISSNFLSFYFNTNFYIFDMAGDCDCPTFSKDGDIMKKGFFIQVSPGLSWLSNEYNNLINNTKQDDSTIVPSIGVGAGLDIGVSDLLTITPIISYRYHFGAEWTDFHTYFEDQVLLEEDNTTSIAVLSFGLRY